MGHINLLTARLFGLLRLYILLLAGFPVYLSFVFVRAFDYTIAAQYLDNSDEMICERYLHLEAGELGDVATEALEVCQL